MEYFSGNKDNEIRVVPLATAFKGRLNGGLIVTDEVEIPLSTCYDYDSISKIAKDFPTALELVKHLKVAFSQKDVKGNNIKVQAVNFCGIVGADKNTEFFTKVESVIADKSKFIYGVSVTWELDTSTMEWMQLYTGAKKIKCFGSKLESDVLSEKSKCEKIRLFFEKEQEGIATAEMMCEMWEPTISGRKFRKLNGITAQSLTDGEVVELDEKGYACYRLVNGVGEVSNSLMSDAKTHTDTIYRNDNIAYLIASNNQSMLQDNSFDSQNCSILVQRYGGYAFYTAEQLKLVEMKDGVGQWNIITPVVDANVRTFRELTNIKYKYLPRTPIERISGDLVEVATEEELTIADLEGVNL